MGLVDIVLAGLCLNLTCPGDEIYRKPHPEQITLKTLLDEIQNENLIITTLTNDRLSHVRRTNLSLTGDGVAFDLLNILQQKFKFNYTIKLPRNNVWGADNTGIRQMLEKNEADLSAAFLPFIPEYTPGIQYSPGLDTGQWVVLMKRPKESATGSGLLAPFTLPVWILILLSLVIVGPLIYLLIYIQAKLCKDDENKIFDLPACIWFVYGALLKQGTTLNPITDSSRLLFSTWWIFITILTAFYTANLTAFLTLSKFTLPINTATDIGAKKSKWVTTRGNALEDALKLNNESSRVLRRTIGQPRQYLLSDDKSILEQYVQHNNMMFIRERPIVDYVMYDDYKVKAKAGIQEADRCTYVMTKFSVVSFSRVFAYSKNFKYKPLFDEAIQHLIESGIIQFKLTEFLPDTQICPLDLGSKERQLRNSDLLMTYMIVGGGFVISSGVFILELILKRFKFKNGKIIMKHKQKARKTLQKDAYSEFPFVSKFVTPPPAYYTLFNPPVEKNARRKLINGREYWVYEQQGEQRLIPMRTPSALLFQFTN